ncbi:MAG: hypothetical protein MK171_10040 [Pirellulales bacterium]|nr:hypothetical protein [Pirellulales bacterium]
MSQVDRNKSVWYAAILAGIAVGVCGWQAGSHKVLAAQLVSPTGASTALITYVVPIADQPTRVIVVDPVQRRIAVYFVSLQSGEIQLKSVRNILGDLSMQEFNSGDPSPLDIENLQKRN